MDSHSDIMSSSIYFQDQEILLSIIPPKNNKKKIIEDMIEGTTSKIFDENNIKKIKCGNYLKIDDFPDKLIAEDFVYSDAIDSISDGIKSLRKELDECNLNNPKDTIYKIKYIGDLIEQTYYYDKNFKNQMIEENCYLEKIIFNWRQILGDGNCFYRSVIFAWLEYLIFHKKINVLKIIISNLYLKFNKEYNNTIILPDEIKRFYISLEKNIAIIVLNIIIDTLTDDSMNEKNRIKKAYIYLIKAFNFSSSFDRTMILYLRYLLYEFILDNKNKAFSKDFEVLIGNLLPQKYENEKGEFNFNEYFYEDLLKYYSFAEKIAIYLTPYVLRINLKVVFYDFGEECNILTKLFTNNLNSKDCLYVLFRKSHYDICYTKDYYSIYCDFLNVYSDFNNKFQVITQEEIENFKKIMPEIKINESKIFNRRLKLKKEEEKNNGQNIEINSLLEKMKLKIETHPSCINCTKLLPQSDIDKYNIFLPCKCRLMYCNNDCLNAFIKNFSSLIENCPLIGNQFIIQCPKCNNQFSRLNLIEFTSELNEKLNDNILKEALKKKLLNLFKNYCMNCLCSLEGKKKYLILCKQKIICNIVDEGKFEHFYCHNCKKKKNSVCQICELYHFKLIT